MSKNYANTIIPGDNIHPGEVLKDELEAREMSQAELSRQTGISKSAISLILDGERNISPETAYSLEKSMGIKAGFWLRFQNKFDLFKNMERVDRLRQAVGRVEKVRHRKQPKSRLETA